MARKSKFYRNHQGIQFRVCETCDGAGELTVNDTNPYGYGPDPQCDEEVTCETCLGDGHLRVTPVDVLERIRSARGMVRWGPGCRGEYLRQRRMQRAVTPRLPAVSRAA